MRSVRSLGDLLLDVGTVSKAPVRLTIYMADSVADCTALICVHTHRHATAYVIMHVRQIYYHTHGSARVY